MSVVYRLSVCMIALLSVLSVRAQYRIDYESSLTVGAGTGDFAPYYISSMCGGRVTSASNVQAEVSLSKKIDYSERLSYGFGFDFMAGYASSVDYERFDGESHKWYYHSERPAVARIQQLYGVIKYRSVFLSAGMREHSSALLNQRLTSGDLVESGNARPIPQIRAGFVDFRDIPYTNGWVQIQGEAGYGRLIDDDWWRDHYNRFNYFIASKTWYNYKRIYFRTRPSERFSVTFGMQAAGEFGGKTVFYSNGRPDRLVKHDASFKTFARMLLPIGEGGEDFYVGNHLGSWDLRARYRLKNNDEVYGYFSWPFEDGSGIGKQNGWDGLWGIEYKWYDGNRLLSGVVVEYLDFTNHSGPIHFDPADWSGTTITGHTSGSDDYYNNQSYNSYANYGQSIGTPALMAPIYNVDGYNAYVANVMRGFHVGLEGCLSRDVSYLVKGGYRKAWGNGYFMLPFPIHLTSVMAEMTWRPKCVSGLSLIAKAELDCGTMPSNAFGALITVKYDGLLKL